MQTGNWPDEVPPKGWALVGGSTVRQSKSKLFLVHTELERRQLEKKVRCGCQQDGEWIAPPLYWLQNWTKTFDEHWQEKQSAPYAKFPQKPYFPFLFGCLMKYERLFIAKSREMMLTWAVVGYAVWACQNFPRTRVMVQSQKQDKVNELKRRAKPYQN